MIARHLHLEPGRQPPAVARRERQIPAADDRRPVGGGLLRKELRDEAAGCCDEAHAAIHFSLPAIGKPRRQIGHGPMRGSLPKLSCTGPSVNVVSVSVIVSVMLLPTIRPLNCAG